MFDFDFDLYCAIWQTPAIRCNEIGTKIHSPRAGGKYFVSGTAKSDLENLTPQKKALITTWLVEQRNSGNNWPEISSKTINKIVHREALEVSTKANRVLHFLSAQTKTPGSRISLQRNGIDRLFVEMPEPQMNYYELLAQCECLNWDELLFMLEFLEQREWIKCTIDDDRVRCGLTVDGYIQIEEQKKTFVDSNRAFVAMWFDDSMNDAWHCGFAPAIEHAGYMPVRIDQQEFVSRIDDEIIAEIRKARFVVADFTQGVTGARGGVYYEAGFAQGLNIPVFFTCRENAIDELHFDIRQYNHIVWQTLDDLRNRLTYRIVAVIGQGPNQLPN